ncbi:hypothetical protein H8959_017622, partial [Pygathrix nigripes]
KQFWLRSPDNTEEEVTWKEAPQAGYCAAVCGGAVSGMPKPKAGRGINYKWSSLHPFEPRTC